jgi:lysophospholipase L1-like esterase
MNEPVIVFAGDSVTDCERNTTADGLGNGYVRVLAEHLRLQGWRVVNRGVSGNRAKDLLTRWQVDVLDESPDVVSIFVGINEVWRRFDSDDPTSDEQYEAELRALVEPFTDTKLVFVEPFLLPKDEAQQLWLKELAGKVHVVRGLAADYGARLVPLHLTMSAAGAAADLAPDGVHPNAAGHQLIADLWLAHAVSALDRSRT